MLTQDVEKLKQAFGDREFNPADMVRVLQLKSQHATGRKLRAMIDQAIIHKTRRGYRFGAQLESPANPVPVVTSEPLCSAPQVVRIGDLFLHERLLLIASVAFQEASPAIRIHTTIIEIDPASKHPRNKVINFIKAREPKEYAQAMAWLASMAGNPPAAVDDTALELAAELESKLNAANAKIAELEAKIAAIRGAL